MGEPTDWCWLSLADSPPLPPASHSTPPPQVRSFVKPPQLVQFVLEAVCILFGQKPTWDNSKRLMAGDFLGTLRNFDKVALRFTP